MAMLSLRGKSRRDRIGAAWQSCAHGLPQLVRREEMGDSPASFFACPPYLAGSAQPLDWVTPFMSVRLLGHRAGKTMGLGAASEE